MEEEKLPLGHGGAGDDCMGKAIKYGTLGAYGEWCAITGTTVFCIALLQLDLLFYQLVI